jgi:hypothetical protein
MTQQMRIRKSSTSGREETRCLGSYDRHMAMRTESHECRLLVLSNNVLDTGGRAASGTASVIRSHSMAI